MANFEKRLSALEASQGNDDLAEAVLAREPDVTAWLLSDSGEPAERASVWAHILSAVDGLSRGLPNAMEV